MWNRRAIHRRVSLPLILVGVAMSAALLFNGGWTLASGAAHKVMGLRAPRAASRLRLGMETLTRCGAAPLTYCGTLSVPLDHRVPAGPQITIAYRWYPATDPHKRPALGTALPIEGGPGYPSIGSVAGGYSVMYGPLLARWNLLAIDLRGTGASTPLDCRPLQTFSGRTASIAFHRTVGVCASALNHRWRYANGDWVHASDLFSSVPAAEDLATVINALGLRRVALYGDSYGSFLAQVFASRFPNLVRSVVLDSTYQTMNLDPWYRTTIRSMPAAFNTACSRSLACISAAAGPAWTRLVKLAGALRRHPISGKVPSHAGAVTRVSMNAVGLVDLLSDAAEDPQIYQQIDASARALLTDHDPAPLLRLYDQRLAADEGYFGQSATRYSVELYLAVSCLDYPQLFDMSASPSRRAAELAHAEASLPASTFSPFTVREWIAQNENTEAYSACMTWPSPTSTRTPLSGTTPLLPRSIPVLVLGGELDTWTPPTGAAAVLAQIGGHSRYIELANTTHVAGEGDTVCGSTLVQTFVARPEAIDSLDAACARSVPAIHTVGRYPYRISAQPPLRPSARSSTPRPALQLAAAAVSTAGDAIARNEATAVSLDRGLFGGTVHASDDGTILTLRGDQLVPEVAVSGQVTLTAPANPSDGQIATATLTASAPGLPTGSFKATWSTTGLKAEAVLRGTVGDRRVSGTMPAP